MQTCPRCGSQAADQAPYCPACGQAMPTSPAQQSPQAVHQGKKTMLGISPDAAPPAAKPPAVGKQTVMGMGMPTDGAPAPATRQGVGHKTVMGMPMEAQQPAAPVVAVDTEDTLPDDPPVVAKNRTMLGMAPPELMAASQSVSKKTMMGVPAPTAPIQPQQQPYAQQQQQQQQQQQPYAQQQQQALQQPSNKKTMLGVAMPGIAPTHEPKSAPPPAPAAQAPLASQHKTMLGVAMPGIAPTHEPNQQHARPQPVSPPYPAAPPPAPPPAAPIPAAPQSKPRRPRVVVAASPLYRRPAFVLAALGISVIVVVGLFVLLWPTKPPIASRAMVNDEGKDVLRLTCPTCPDGTVMTIEGATAKVASGEADIALPKPLTVGDNHFAVQIDRPGSGRDESVDLSMPVAFRVRPDLEGLDGDPPTFHVEIEAAPETSILIDGTAVKLDASGKARYPVDVSEACTGANAEVATIDRKVPYTIQPKGGKPSSGTVAVKVGISPLTLQAPRPHMVVDSEHFLVAGRTTRGALVEIEGAKFAAGADGTFSRKMQIKRPGETKVRVRARLPDHAPRTIAFSVKRVADMETEAKTFEARAATDVRALMENVDAHRDKEVAVRGEVVEARTQGFVRIVLLDTVGQCSKPPCLARLVYAGTEALAKGDVVRVFGRVSGAQSAGGKSVPEIDVDFLLKGR